MCTVALWSNNDVAVVSARNMDWLEGMESDIWLFPRGMSRTGFEGDSNSLNWTSEYGSVVTSSYNLAAADGVNEKSLAMHMLWLAESDYGVRDVSLPGLSVGLWGQFFLDNFSTVVEAVDYIRDNPFQLSTATVGSAKLKATVHMQIEDGSGDVAIFEYINGKLKISHDKELTVMTNSPTLDKQLENIKQYKGFGGEKILPGTTQAADRFVRAAYYLKHLNKPKDSLEVVAGIVSVLRNTAQPFGVVSDPGQPNISPTLWRTIIDHTNMVYYFESSTSPYLVWVDLSKVDFSGNVMKLNLHSEKNMIGESSAKMVKAEPFNWAMPQA